MSTQETSGARNTHIQEAHHAAQATTETETLKYASPKKSSTEKVLEEKKNTRQRSSYTRPNRKKEGIIFFFKTGRGPTAKWISFSDFFRFFPHFIVFISVL